MTLEFGKYIESLSVKTIEAVEGERSLTLENLDAGSVYHYRLTATNDAGLTDASQIHSTGSSLPCGSKVAIALSVTGFIVVCVLIFLW